MDPFLPKPDYDEDPEWYWPFNKFPLDPNDLFTTLHDRFNTRPFPLQDPVAFHRDVYECADSSDTVDEFYSRLEERKAQRIEEMSEGWDEVSTLLISFPTLLCCQLCYDPETRDVKMKPGTKNDSMGQRRFAFLQYARYMSFDNLVTFFDGFVRDEREEQEKIRRWANEDIERMRRERAAKRAAAASRAIEATTSDSPRRTSPRIARNKLKSPYSTSTSNSESPATPAVASEQPRPTSSSRRPGPHQADGLSPGQTGESSRGRKRRSDEEAHKSAGKRRRIASEDVGAEVGDTGRPAAGQDESGGAGAASTSARSKKRKSTGVSRGEARKKRAKITDSPNNRSRQSPRRSTNQHQLGQAPASTERDSSIPSTAVPSDYDQGTADEERIQKNSSILDPNKAFYIEEPTASPSERNSIVNTGFPGQSPLSGINDTTQLPVQSDDGEHVRVQRADEITDPNRAFYIEESSRSLSGRRSELSESNQELLQADEDGRAHGLTTKISTPAAETKKPESKLQSKPRASSRNRVDKRRSTKGQSSSAPKKQLRRKKPQERNPSPSTQRLIRSTRSSRRDPKQELWFLGDDSVACAVGNTKRA